jgi:hypothetical protein
VRHTPSPSLAELDLSCNAGRRSWPGTPTYRRDDRDYGEEGQVDRTRIQREVRRPVAHVIGGPLVVAFGIELENEKRNKFHVFFDRISVWRPCEFLHSSTKWSKPLSSARLSPLLSLLDRRMSTVYIWIQQVSHSAFLSVSKTLQRPHSIYI